MQGTTLRSVDLECIAFFNVYKPFTTKDVDEIKRIFPNSPIAVDEMHIGQIKGNIIMEIGSVVTQFTLHYLHSHVEGKLTIMLRNTIKHLSTS